jgi:antitoxin component of MazEF toxin-antitoxin module
MVLLTSRTRSQGGSIVTTLPAEVVRRLGLSPETALHWQEIRPGVFEVMAVNPETLATLEAHEEVIAAYRDVFAALAK